MKAAYERQKPENIPEPADPAILSTGLQLRDDVLNEYHQKHAGTNYRILLIAPKGGVGLYWFNDLAQSLNHCGVPAEAVSILDESLYTKWEAFKPSVILGIDSLTYLRRLKLDFINQYKNKHGLIRLFTPVAPYRFPRPGLSAEDYWRLNLAKSGQSVDAYFSMMPESFFEKFQSSWHQAGFKYLYLPFAANPFKHYPRNEDKIYDYFMATSFGYERAFLTYQYIQPIFKKYHGLWAGPDWRFGLGEIPPEETPNFRAMAKIIVNPLPDFNRKYAADLTERAFTAAACGAFQITSQSPVTHLFFNPDELVCAKNPAEFNQLFDYYLPRTKERNQIALHGMKRVFKDHTYFHRIDTLLAFIDSINN
jgi:hypothetical protein